ncbi:MAG: hypothetical protein QOI12_1986 [Alphaproteobacteria bacterium]|jgi:uncharacterized protein GlcG (DUF336 family)|nr:hypothetical protein [Alphaproteobacteria bacterium]
MIRSRALAAAAGLAALTAAQAMAADPLPTETYKVLPAALSLEAAQAALAACKAQGYNVTVSVANRFGLAQILIVGDGASPTGRSLAPRKAYTSAVRRISTGELNTRVSVPDAFNPLQFDAQLTIERGGVPINVDKDTIGAIAVSGAPGGEKDEACADAGIAKIADRLK